MSRRELATSVVVSTYDEKRWEELTACIASLAVQSIPPLETILVVDHNTDLLEKAREAFPKTVVIPNANTRGLAGARNSGIAVAQCEIIAFIDDDARAEPQWLAKIQECFTDPTTVGVGGALLPFWQGPEPRWLPREFYWVIGCSYTGLPEGLAPLRNPIGANMAARASILADVGGFREGGAADAPRELRSRGVVRAGGNIPDDTDLAIRVSLRFPAAVWLYQPEAIVLHTVTAERSSLAYFIRRCYEEGTGKAHLSHYVGHQAGLHSERRYLAVAIPRGIGSGLRQALGGEGAGAARAAAILAGVLVTATGFVVANLGRVLRPGAAPV